MIWGRRIQLTVFPRRLGDLPPISGLFAVFGLLRRLRACPACRRGSLEVRRRWQALPTAMPAGISLADEEQAGVDDVQAALGQLLKRFADVEDLSAGPREVRPAADPK